MRLGEHTKSTTPDCKEFYTGEKLCADEVQDIAITTNDLVIHEEFNFIEVKHDIAIIRLNEAAKVQQNNIKIICLPFKHEKLPKDFLVIGFGQTKTSGTNSSDVLMKVGIKLRDSEDCTFVRKNGKSFGIDETQICAGGKLAIFTQIKLQF